MRRILLVLFLLSCTGLGAARAQGPGDPGRVLWPYFSYPPFVVIEDDGEPGGLYWEVRERLWERLPEYEHVALESPFTRSMLGVREGGRYCFTGILKTPERELELVFSRPFSVGLSHVVVCRQGALDAYKENGTVSLARLLADRRLVFGLVDGLSHGPVLDAIIAPHRDEEHVFTVRRMRPMALQFNLVRAGRTDFFLSHGFQASYESGLHGGEGLEFVPVIEDGEPFPVYVACSAGLWGREIIGRIDAVLEESVADPDFEGLFLDGLDQRLRPVFQDAYDRLVLGRMPPVGP